MQNLSKQFHRLLNLKIEAQAKISRFFVDRCFLAVMTGECLTVNQAVYFRLQTYMSPSYEYSDLHYSKGNNNNHYHSEVLFNPLVPILICCYDHEEFQQPTVKLRSDLWCRPLAIYILLWRLLRISISFGKGELVLPCHGTHGSLYV